MKTYAKRTLSLLMAALLLVSMLPTAGFAVSTADITLNGSSVEYNEHSAQQATVTLATNYELNFNVIEATFPDKDLNNKLKIKSLSIMDGITIGEYDYCDVYGDDGGIVTWSAMDNVTAPSGTAILTAVYEVPAGTIAGDYTINLDLKSFGSSSDAEKIKNATLTATITVNEAAEAEEPVANSAFELWYELESEKDDLTTVAGYKDYNAKSDVTATLYLKSTANASVVQAYDIYLTYNDKLSYKGEDMAGVAYKDASNTAVAAGETVTHIQLVKEAGKYISLAKNTPVSLGTVTFTIKDSAVYDVDLAITLTPGNSTDKSGSNLALQDTTGSFYPAVTGTVKGAEVAEKKTVTFNVNTPKGASATVSEMTAQEVGYGISTALTANAFKVTGYHFTGWNTAANGSGTAYVDGAKYDFKENLTLYAQWDFDTFTVTFVDDDNTNINGPTTYNYGATVTKPSNPTKTATAQYTYTFAGWRDTESNTLYGPNDALPTVSKDVTYKAEYTSTVNKYTVTWKNEDGTVLETDENVEYGTTPTYDGGTPTKAANAQYTYTFNGWTPAVEAVKGDATYTATYSEAVNQYTITFDQGDHGTLTDSEKSQKLDYGSSVTLPTPTENTGYTFDGWYDGDTKVTSLTVTGDKTLKAKYNPITYTVNYNSNGGTGTMASQNFTYDDNPTQTLTANAFAKTKTEGGKTLRYTFKGWSKTPNPAEDANTDIDNSATMNSTTIASLFGTETSITLYAVWSQADYTITYELNGGAITTANHPTTYDSTQLPKTFTVDASKDGYTFDGWTVTAPSSGVTVSDKTQVTIAAGTKSDITLTATWTAIDYDVTVNDPTNGSASADKTTAHVGDTVKVTATPATGYKLGSIVVTYGNNNPVAVDGDSFTMPASAVTVTVTFQPISYTIRFAPGEGSGTMNDIPAVYGTTYALPANAFTKTGYSFKEWSGSDGNTYADKKSVLNLAETEGATVTLTAQWEIESYTITVATGEHGTLTDTANPTAEYNSSYTLPTAENSATYVTPAPGYEFDYWLVGTDHKSGGESITITGPVTITAQFKTSNYTVTYNANGGETLSNLTYTILSTDTLATPTRAGYTFAGWKVKATAGNWTAGTILANSDGNNTYALNSNYGNVELEAQWTAKTYTITFDVNGGSMPEGVGTTMTYTIESDAKLPIPSNGLYTFDGWLLTVADGDSNWGTVDTARYGGGSAEVPVKSHRGNITLMAQWKFNITYKVEEYKYAPENYVMLRIDAGTLTDKQTYTFNNAALYYTADSNYLFESGTGVFYTLIEKTYAETKTEGEVTSLTGKLTAAGAALVSIDTVESRSTIAYDGDVNGDGVVNIADANAVYQMVQNKGSYYALALLDIRGRLAADLVKTDAGNNEFRGTIADVNWIVDTINGVGNG